MKLINIPVTFIYCSNEPNYEIDGKLVDNKIYHKIKEDLPKEAVIKEVDTMHERPGFVYFNFEDLPMFTVADSNIKNQMCTCIDFLDVNMLVIYIKETKEEFAILLENAYHKLNENGK